MSLQPAIEIPAVMAHCAYCLSTTTWGLKRRFFAMTNGTSWYYYCADCGAQMMYPDTELFFKAAWFGKIDRGVIYHPNKEALVVINWAREVVG